MAAPHRILGIDPGTRSVGWGVVEASGNAMRRIDAGTIRAKGDEIPERLVVIHAELQRVIDEHAPSVAAVETVFGGENIRTAIAIGEGRGVAVLSAAEKGLEVFGYEPATVKRAIAGSGRASKEQVQEMVGVLLNLAEAPSSDHEADALALAIAHVQRARTEAVTGVRPGPRRGYAGARRGRKRKS